MKGSFCNYCGVFDHYCHLMESFKKVVADEDRAESTNRVGSHYRMQDIRSHTETDNFGEAFLSELTL